MGASIATPLGSRKLAWTAAAIAAAAGIVGFPVIGVPVAVGIGTYIAIKLSKPHAIVRGRILSPRQHRRAAMIVGGGMLAFAALFSGTLLALELANRLEHRLHDPLKAAYRRGELKPGQMFEECSLACARATVVELATPNAPGIAKLSGLALHDHTIYHWRNSSGQLDGPAAR
jgi:hypothetical protein